jgi:small subunit ribosomal protein S23
MGRYDFRPQRVLRTAEQLLETKRITRSPCWFNVVSDIPPAQVLVRPLQQRKNVRPGTRKSSKMFQPAKITYPEDRLRSEFFGDHPWELARPRVLLEDSGNDAKSWDWSRIQQPGKRMDGESVVQRQMWLMEHEGLDEAHAYDKARKEFYFYRHREDVERRVAKEEALATGAYFGKGPIEIGMELENQQWEDWKAWALKEIEKEKQRVGASYDGTDSEEANPTAEEQEAALDESGSNVPGSQVGYDTPGGLPQTRSDIAETPINLQNRIPESVPVPS